MGLECSCVMHAGDAEVHESMLNVDADGHVMHACRLAFMIAHR